MRHARRVIFILLLSAMLTGCWEGPHVATLDAPTAPPTPALGMTAPASTGVPSVAPTVVVTVTLPAVTAAPSLTMFCTTDAVRLRAEATTSSDELLLAGQGTTVIQVSEDTLQADGHTWLNVEVSGTRGWMASDWLRAGDCNQAAAGGETPVIVDGAYVSGYAWEETGSLGETHYGVDIQSGSDSTVIQAPFAGTVAASDACEACTELDEEEGNAQGETGSEYNYGYGAAAIVEFAYEDLTEEQRTSLADDGIAISAGQSLYLMVAHLDPAGVPEVGGALNAGGDIADIGNSGNSYGAHAHVEAAVNDSGLRPGEDENIANFWYSDVVERANVGEQGLRVDPTPLFDVAD